MTSAHLTDAIGKLHQQAGPGARIACFVPSITELVIDLGLADQLVARTQYCIHPAETVKDIPAIGGTKKVSIPKLKKIRPSHAILNIDENTREMDAAIRELGIEVIVTHPVEPADSLGLFRLIGGMFGKEDEAQAFCAQFEASMSRLQSATALLPRRKVCYFCWNDPWMTVSRDTFISRTLALANLETVQHDPDTRYPTVEVDGALLAESDLFLFSTEPFAFTQGHADAFAETHGINRARCRVIDGEYASWYGTRAIPALDYLRDFAASIALD